MLLNDFVAVGLSLSCVPQGDVHTLHDAERDDHGVIACLGPGTGLGNVFTVWSDELEERISMPSEGCMNTFAPRDQEGWDFYGWVTKEREEHDGMPPPADITISGTGIGLWYRFLRSRHPDLVDPAIDQEFNAASAQPAAVVATYDGKNELCTRSIDRCIGQARKHC